MYNARNEQLKEKCWSYLDGQMTAEEKNAYESELAQNVELSQYVVKRKKLFDNIKNHIPNVIIDPVLMKKIEGDFQSIFGNFPITSEVGFFDKLKKALSINH